MQRKIFLCFVDYSQAFDIGFLHYGQHILQEIEITFHLRLLICNPYDGQAARVRTEKGTIDWLSLGQSEGVR